MAGMARAQRWSGPNGGNRDARAPLVVTDLEDLELDGFEDDDGFSERSITGFAVATDAERVGIARSEVVRMRLTAARMRRFDVSDVWFRDCDLSQAVLDEFVAVRTTFERCRFSAADLGGARLTDVRFHDCDLEGAALRLVVGERVEVRGGRATGVDLYRSRLAGSAWLDTDLTGADLSGADLARARFHGSKLHDLRGASALRGAHIDRDQTVDVGLALIADSEITIDPVP